jgi:hypothetical protein
VANLDSHFCGHGSIDVTGNLMGGKNVERVALKVKDANVASFTNALHALESQFTLKAKTTPDVRFQALVGPACLILKRGIKTGSRANSLKAVRFSWLSFSSKYTRRATSKDGGASVFE